MNVLPGCILSLLVVFQPGLAGRAEPNSPFDLTSYLDLRSAEFDQIEPARRQALDQIAGYIQTCGVERREARLVFICTANSRRSQLSQVWAAVAAHRAGLSHVCSFSGGTEATAFNPRAIAALQRAGLSVSNALASSDNPIYLVSVGDGPPLACFSKRYDDPPNPIDGFCAVFACTNADEACPTVSGAELRVALPFEDPKLADDTEAETAAYDERSAQICRELLYVMSRVRQ